MCILMFYEVNYASYCLYSQVKSNNEFWKWTTWTVLQALPSITYYDDRDQNNSSVKFGFQWQVIPFSYTFRVNKYLSKYNFFFIRPVKRFSGSLEIFFEPDYVIGEFKYSDLKKFMFQSGTRVILPVAQGGEYLSFSVGAGYYYQRSNTTGVNDGVTYEGAVYSFFGMLGLKFNYNVNAPSRYNISLYIKYY